MMNHLSCQCVTQYICDEWYPEQKLHCTTAEFIHLILGLHVTKSIWSDCAQCPVVSALWLLNHLCCGAGWRLKRQVIVHHKMENRLWWGEKSEQRQGILKQKHCFQLKPLLQRVQVLGLPMGALECNWAGALSGAKRGQNVGERPRGAWDLYHNQKEVGEALLEAYDYRQ